MACGVYQIKNTVTGDFYIGSSNDLERRWREHQKLLNRAKHTNPRLQYAWSKYGVMAFVFLIVEECDPAGRIEVEQYHLDWMEPTYNIAPIAHLPGPGYRSPEHRAKIAAAQRAAWRANPRRFDDRVISAETRSRIAAKKVGRKRAPFSDVHRQRLALATIRRGFVPRVVPPRIRTQEERSRRQASILSALSNPAVRSRISQAKTEYWARWREQDHLTPPSRYVATYPGGVGRPMSEETRAKIGAANSGREHAPWTDERKEKVATAKREWWARHKAAMAAKEVT